MLRRSLFAVLCPVVVVLAGTPADAATRYEVKSQSATVRNGPASFEASGFVIGSVYGARSAGPAVRAKETFDLVRKSASGKWAYGHVNGSYRANGACGWVQLSSLRNTGKSASAPACPPVNGDAPSDDSFAASKLFAAGTFVFGTGGGTVQRAKIVACANQYAYGNYDPATKTFSNRYPAKLPTGRGTYKGKKPSAARGYSGFGTRYLTADRQAWLIKDSKSPAGRAAGKRFPVPTWHFVRADCLKRL